MAIYRFDRFQNDVEYYTGAGCLVCGSNLGACIDLGVYDSIEGAIVLCEDHARECGVMVGMVDPRGLEERERELIRKAEEVAKQAEIMEESRERAEQTRRYIEDLLRHDEKPATLPKKSLKKDSQ